jgi:hypothetical protein
MEDEMAQMNKANARKRVVQPSVQQDMDNCFGFDEEDEEEDELEDEMPSKATVHILQPAMH